MIRDLGEQSSAALPAYDLCIIGSGPAGMTLAAELAGSGISLCVLESGRLRPSAQGDRLRRVVSEGIRIKDYSRERVLGGASTTWAGLSSPLDEIDFRERPWMSRSGWPIARAELCEFYARAAERYRFPALASFGPEGFGALRARGEHQPAWDELEEKIFLAAAEPQDFGREQRGAFEREGADLYLDATVLRLVREPGTARVAHALARTSAGREWRVEARCFVLATGGIENARLLLVSGDADTAGLGNEHDQVGRCLMNHPKNYHGILRLERPVTKLPYYFGCLWNGFAGYAGLKLSEREQQGRKVLNSYVRFEPLFPWSDSRGVESLVTLAKRSKLVLDRFRKRGAGELVELRDYAETGDDSDLQNERKSMSGWLGLGWNVAADAPRVSRYAWNRLFARKRPRITAVRLRNFMEMEPRPENRVTLATELDAHGVPLPLVRHSPTELDRRSLAALHEVLRTELARAGLGTLATDLAGADPWPIDQDASHHMGTTRMGTDPRTSVVDPQCRVHGVANVHVAGASVFPTSGCANPTFTLVALSIRLAATLRRELGSRAERAPAR